MKNLKEIISYVIWGGITTLVNWAVYVLCVRFLKMQPAVGNVIAWVAAVLVAYVSNKLYVFENKSWKNIKKEFLMFVSARLFSGVIEIVGLPVLISVFSWKSLFGIEGICEKILISVVVVILNYVFSKWIIFKK